MEPCPRQRSRPRGHQVDAELGCVRLRRQQALHVRTPPGRTRGARRMLQPLRRRRRLEAVPPLRVRVHELGRCGCSTMAVVLWWPAWLHHGRTFAKPCYLWVACIGGRRRRLLGKTDLAKEGQRSRRSPIIRASMHSRLWSMRSGGGEHGSLHASTESRHDWRMLQAIYVSYHA